MRINRWWEDYFVCLFFSFLLFFFWLFGCLTFSVHLFSVYSIDTHIYTQYLFGTILVILLLSIALLYQWVEFLFFLQFYCEIILISMKINSRIKGKTARRTIMLYKTFFLFSHFLSSARIRKSYIDSYFYSLQSFKSRGKKVRSIKCLLKNSHDTLHNIKIKKVPFYSFHNDRIRCAI